MQNKMTRPITTVIESVSHRPKLQSVIQSSDDVEETGESDMNMVVFDTVNVDLSSQCVPLSACTTEKEIVGKPTLKYNVAKSIGSCADGAYCGKEYKMCDLNGEVDSKKGHTEEGLSLLFAASLIQQEERSKVGVTGLHSNFDHTHLLSLPDSSKVGPATTEMRFNETNSSDTVKTITDKDVLCGRGGGINKHSGNVVYRRVVEYNKVLYKHVPKRHRMLVSQSIVQAILNSGGRFLQQQQDCTSLSQDAQKWKEITFRRAVQKTSQALRERNEDESDDMFNGNEDHLQFNRNDLAEESRIMDKVAAVAITNLQTASSERKRKSEMEIGYALNPTNSSPKDIPWSS